MSQLIKFLFVLVFVLLLPLNSAFAQRGEATKEYLLKAAFVYKFVSFVSWPHKFKGKKFFNMCFGGETHKDNFKNSLDELNYKTIKSSGLKINIRRNVKIANYSKCDLLFVTHSSDGFIESVIQNTAQHPILTIGEDEIFAEKGGMISIFPSSGKMRFTVNPSAAEAKKISISSDLLKLATKVIR